MKRVIGMFLAASLLIAPSAWAIDITITPGAAVQVGTNNTITINPVTLNADLPGYPRGNYSVTFQWHSGANALIPVSATRVGGNETPTGGAVGREINGVLIEAETFAPGALGCTLKVQVLNQTSQLKTITLTYNAFDAAGRGIGYTILYSVVSAKSRITIASWFITPSGGGGLLSCNQIARYELDPFSFVSP